MSLKQENEKYCRCCGTPKERHLSVASAAILYDCSEQFFRNLVRDRKIGFIRIGKLIRIPESELQKIIKNLPSISEELNRTMKI